MSAVLRIVMMTSLKNVILILISVLALLACQTVLVPSTDSKPLPQSIDHNEDVIVPLPDIPDSDGDGVLDHIDHCPKTLANTIVDEKGCPTAVNLIGRLSMEVRVFFGEQSLTFRSSDSTYNELNKVAIKMQKYPQATTAVFGNISTIEMQVNPQNRLAHDRAQLVKEILITQGVPERSIQTFDCSDHKQIASNDSEESESFNRRVYVRMFYNDQNDYLTQKDTYDCRQF